MKNQQGSLAFLHFLINNNNFLTIQSAVYISVFFRHDNCYVQLMTSMTVLQLKK